MFLIISSNYDHDIMPKYKHFPTQKKTKDKEKKEGKAFMLVCLDLYTFFFPLISLHASKEKVKRESFHTQKEKVKREISIRKQVKRSK